MKNDGIANAFELFDELAKDFSIQNLRSKILQCSFGF